jgi:hypothetical protein
MKGNGGEGIASLRSMIRTGDLQNTKQDDKPFIADEFNTVHTVYLQIHNDTYW